MALHLLAALYWLCIGSQALDLKHRYHQIRHSAIVSKLSGSLSPQKHDGYNEFGQDVLSNCSEYYYEQYLDHYNYRAAPNGNTTYMQRYFICGGKNWTPNNTIFFYTGNEGPVELYINNTGLMWQNQDSFDAIMIFAEHRYFGKSIPFGIPQILADETLFSYLSPDQALADYATLINYLKTKWSSWNSSVLAFGGSYGGMLCSWFRIKCMMIILLQTM